MENDHPEAGWSMIDFDKSVNRNWTFSNAGTTFTTANITFTWQASELDAGTTPANFKLAAYDGAAWALLTTTASAGNSIQATGLTSFREYAVGENISSFKWTGGAMTSDWFTAKNWSGGIPNTTYNTIIPNGLYTGRVYPVLAAGTGVVKDITIDNAASLVVNGGTLKIAGTITNNGVLDAKQGGADFNGSANQFITAGMFTGNKIMDLQISNNVFLQTVDTLTGTLNVTAGKTFTTNNNLVLRSDALGTARVGALPVDGAGAATAFITGKLTIERYIPLRKAWRLLSAPVKASGSPTINAAWQEGLTSASPNPNLYPGYGVMIQGGTTANGFDQGLTTNPSIKIFSNAANNFVGLPSSPGTNVAITNYPGYFLYIRGDRSINLMQGNNAATTKTTLRIKGDINTGKVTTAVNATGYTVFGNPYPSAIDFGTLTRANVKNTFYIWDPKLAGAYGLGAYVTVSYNNSTGSYDITTAASPASQYIPSGEAVLIQSADGLTAGSITVKETDKTTGGSDFVFGRTNGLKQQLRLNLYSMEPTAGKALLDGVLTTYDFDQSNGVDGDDAVKLSGGSENIGLKRQGQMLSIERRAPIAQNDTSFVNLYQLKTQNYQLEIVADNFDKSNLIAILKDSYDNTINNLPLNANGATLVNFTVNSDPASYALGRFSIVFSSAAVLPVTFNTIKATRQQKDIAVDWTVSNEINIKQYEIERSGDGRYFQKIGTKTLNNMSSSFSSYRFIDSIPLEGPNFYRIKSIDQNSSNAYSNTVNVAAQSVQVNPTVNVYPNPVTGASVSLRMNRVAEGNYEVQIFSMSGQLLQSLHLYHDGTSSLQKIALPANFAPGKYELKISGNEFSSVIPLLKK